MLAKLWCWAFGHSYIFQHRLSDAACRYKCDNCGSDIAHHQPTGISVTYSEEVKAFYKILDGIK